MSRKGAKRQGSLAASFGFSGACSAGFEEVGHALPVLARFSLAQLLDRTLRCRRLPSSALVLANSGVSCSD